MRMMITVQLEASKLPVRGPLPFKRLQFLLTSEGFEAININHECEDRKEKSVLRITD